MNGNILRVRNLVVDYPTSRGVIRAVDNVSLRVEAGERVGVVGESGSGKSTLAFALMRLLRRPGRVTGGSVELAGRDLMALDDSAFRSIRGKEIAMVFQDPFTYLNPVMRVGDQVMEVVLAHRPIDRRLARRYVLEALESLALTDPEGLFKAYPHQLSGGQRQRVVIAMAIVLRPRLIVADEPTTALDVTVQAQILDLLKDTIETIDSALLIISHDLQVVRSLCHRLYVMYAGQVIEDGPTEDVLTRTEHPYTEALLRSSGRLYGSQKRLEPIPGDPPDMASLPSGCRFAPRCTFRMAECTTDPPVFQLSDVHAARCWLHAEGGRERA